MSRDNQNEIHELAKQMSEAISTAVEQRYIEDEAKLRAALIENGWRKSAELAEEIFAEIERFLVEKLSSINAFRKKGDSFYDGEIHALELLLYKNAELKKKYIGKDTNVTTNTEEGK